MRLVFVQLLLALGLTPALAQTDDPLAALKWEARPIVIFADSDRDPRFRQQLEMLERDIDELEARDVVILTDTDPSVLSPLRERLRPRGFMFVLIGKEGQVKYRKPGPVKAAEIIRLIDRMPLRQQEISEAKQRLIE